MRHLRLNTDLYRTLVLTLLAGMAAVTVAMANRNVYTKDQVDIRMDATAAVEAERHRSLDDDVAEIKDGVQWIMRRMGEANYETGQGNHTP